MKTNSDQFLESFDPAVMPLGIITLEDVLEGTINTSAIPVPLLTSVHQN